MLKFRTHFFAALGLLAVTGIGSSSYAQTTPPPTGASITTPASSAPHSGPVQVAQFAELQQNDSINADATVTPVAIAAPARAPQPLEFTVHPRNEGWIARAHQTANTWIYGEPILGAIEHEPMKAFTVKGMSIPLASLAEGAKRLPKGQSYAYSLEGQFEVTRGGKYGMAVELTAKTPAKGVVIGGLNWQHDVCETSLLVDDEPVVEKDGRVGKDRYSDDVFSILGSGRINLAPGIHTIKATINCALPAYHESFGAMWTLKVRGPNAVEPTLPMPAFVFHEKPDTTL